MDIAKYIGLFLLKNHFCYVHGLGNMELIKRPAIHDGKALQAPSYEVIVTQGGSIDDNLANFIATNEQISISKAANTLRDYSIQTKKDLAAGKEVPIADIGKLIETNGKIKFVTDEKFQFTPAGIPTIKNSKQLEEQNAKPVHKPSYPVPHKADSINWSMVILVIILLIIIGGGGYGIWYYTNQNKSINQPVAPSAKDTIIQAPVALIPPDSTQLPKDTTALAAPPLPADTLQVNTYRMIIGDYPTRERAEKRVRNLKINGNNVDMIQKDSLNFLVVTTVNCRVADTTHVIDSLERLFGYKSVMTFK